MNIHTHLLGAHLKVQSFNAVPPAQRTRPAPPALVLVCHGVFVPDGTAAITVPSGIEVRFAVPHGRANENTDTKFYKDLIGMGLQSALQYDFKHLPDGSTVPDYALGKGEPDPGKGSTPAEMMAYDKDDRPHHPVVFDPRQIGQVEVVSAAYIENIQLLAASLKKTDTFDFASIRAGTRSLKDVFDTITQTRPKYDYLLCNFCREPV